MKNVKVFTPTVLDTLRPKLQDAINKVLSEHGLSGELGRMGYQPDTFTVKLTVAVGTDLEKTMWDKHCGIWDLKPDDYGKAITINRRKGMIEGIQPKGRKYQVIVADNGGTRRTYRACDVIKALGRPVPDWMKPYTGRGEVV